MLFWFLTPENRRDHRAFPYDQLVSNLLFFEIPNIRPRLPQRHESLRLLDRCSEVGRCSLPRVYRVQSVSDGFELLRTVSDRFWTALDYFPIVLHRFRTVLERFRAILFFGQFVVALLFWKNLRANFKKHSKHVSMRQLILMRPILTVPISSGPCGWLLPGM